MNISLTQTGQNATEFIKILIKTLKKIDFLVNDIQIENGEKCVAGGWYAFAHIFLLRRSETPRREHWTED